jgi:hypothetical protein
MATCIYLRISYGCFYAVMPEFSSYDRDLMVPLAKNVYDLLIIEEDG